MPLDANVMAADVVAAMKNTITLTPDQEAAALATWVDISGAIIDHFKNNAQVPLGIAVQVTPATGTGATTAPGSIV